MREDLGTMITAMAFPMCDSFKMSKKSRLQCIAIICQIIDDLTEEDLLKWHKATENKIIFREYDKDKSEDKNFDGTMYWGKNK